MQFSGNYTEESFWGKTASNDAIIITVPFSASGEARLKNVTASTIKKHWIIKSLYSEWCLHSTPLSDVTTLFRVQCKCFRGLKYL